MHSPLLGPSIINKTLFFGEILVPRNLWAWWEGNQEREMQGAEKLPLNLRARRKVTCSWQGLESPERGCVLDYTDRGVGLKLGVKGPASQSRVLFRSCFHFQRKFLSNWEISQNFAFGNSGYWNFLQTSFSSLRELCFVMRMKFHFLEWGASEPQNFLLSEKGRATSQNVDEDRAGETLTPTTMKSVLLTPTCN